MFWFPWDLSLSKHGFPGGASGKEPTCQFRRYKTQGVRSLRWEDPPEVGMATHSSSLAWRIPWTEEPGGPQSMWTQRVGQDWGNLANMHGSLSRDPACTPCIGRWCLNHWTTREVPAFTLQIHPKPNFYFTLPRLRKFLYGLFVNSVIFNLIIPVRKLATNPNSLLLPHLLSLSSLDFYLSYFSILSPYFGSLLRNCRKD